MTAEGSATRAWRASAKVIRAWLCGFTAEHWGPKRAVTSGAGRFPRWPARFFPPPPPARHLPAVLKGRCLLEPADDYVLVIEDDPDLLESIGIVLGGAGHAFVTASDGSHGLEALRSRPRPPCLVLLDLMMPGMSGFEVRVAMKADPSLASIPVVVVTGAGVLAEQRAGELDASILAKPVQVPDLLAAVRRHCRRAADVAVGQTEAAQAPPSSSRSGPRRSRLLVVDDEALFVQALRRALEGDHDVSTTADAKEALRRIADGETFDLILCDFVMPQMSGMELYQALAAEAPEHAARMVFLTGGACTREGRAFLDTTSNLVIEKPIDLKTLRAVIAGRLANLA